MTTERFELIARYIVAANDVIDVCGTEAMEALKILLQAAHAEALKGVEGAATAIQSVPVQLGGSAAEGVRMC